MGTIWPRPLVFHTTLTAECVEGLAQLVEEHIAPEIADHLHVYRGTEVLLEWYDFPTDPFWLSKAIPEEAVKDFCVKLGIQYTDSADSV